MNFLIIKAEEFIAAITQHIPDKFFQMIRYLGWYSNRMRGDRKKTANQPADLNSTSTPEEVLDVSAYKPRRIPPKTWRDCIKKVLEVDPLECPKCHCEMKIISFISTSQKEVIRQILEHLGLWENEIRPPPSGRPPEIEITYEPLDDGWTQYDEPAITIK